MIFLSDRLPEILKKILETSPPDNFLTLGLRELSCYLQSSLPFPVCSREGGLSATCENPYENPLQDLQHTLAEPWLRKAPKYRLVTFDVGFPKLT